jgi:hypothetical protein
MEFGPNLLYSLLTTTIFTTSSYTAGKMSVPVALADIEKSTVSIWVHFVPRRE